MIKLIFLRNLITNQIILDHDEIDGDRRNIEMCSQELFSFLTKFYKGNFFKKSWKCNQ